MPTFKQGDVIKVPFPYTDRATRKSRPALVVSSGTLEEVHGLLWVVMITQKNGLGRQRSFGDHSAGPAYDG